MTSGVAASASPNAPAYIFGRPNPNFVPSGADPNAPAPTLDSFGIKALPDVEANWDDPNDPVVNGMIEGYHSLHMKYQKRSEDLREMKRLIADEFAKGDAETTALLKKMNVSVSKPAVVLDKDGALADIVASTDPEVQNNMMDYWQSAPVEYAPEYVQQNHPLLYAQCQKPYFQEGETPYETVVTRIETTAFKPARRGRVPAKLEDKVKKARELDRTVKKMKEAKKAITDEFANNLGPGRHEFAQGILTVRGKVRFNQALAQQVLDGLPESAKRQIAVRKAPNAAELRQIAPKIAKSNTAEGRRKVNLNAKS